MGLSSRALVAGLPARAGRRDRGALSARSYGVRTPAAPRSPRGHRGRPIPLSLPTCAIEARLAVFERRHNATAAAFDWRFTATDLDDLPRPQGRPRQAPTTEAA